MAMVKATVIRGTFLKIQDDGTRLPVGPGLGKDSEIEIDEAQLDNYKGILVRSSEAAVAVKAAATESMAPSTATGAAIAPPTPQGQQQAAAATAAQRRTR